MTTTTTGGMFRGQGYTMSATATHPTNLETRSEIGSQQLRGGFALDHQSVKLQAGDGADKPDTFSGVAYSGGAASTLWGRLVIDIEGMQLSDRVPSMYNHEDPIGFVDSMEKKDGAFLVSGQFLKTSEKAKKLKLDSDQGYPLEMSVWVDFEEVREIPAGETLEANGQTFDGPLIFAVKSNLREVSIVDVGADPNTIAQLAATARPTHNPQQGADLMNTKQKSKLNALLGALTDEERDETIAKLQAAKQADDDADDDDAKPDADDDADSKNADDDDAKPDADDDADSKNAKNAATLAELKAIPEVTSDQVLDAFERKLSLPDAQAEIIASLTERLKASTKAGGAEPVKLGARQSLTLTDTVSESDIIPGCAGSDPADDWKNSEQLRKHWGSKQRAAFMSFAGMQSKRGERWDLRIHDEDAA